ncbi:hypothetical protein LSH36_316g01001 [Paralvinella palmiformis]|uniref:Poly [ADP-ribose] polymerase n=1 Tax=Paralvinella palmiformis TaxID=53620 RepID=A0AAD9N128_9ANNE|nr:hypothetical protein LSH36_316g01001 [Paralvinella palmiformis]
MMEAYEQHKYRISDYSSDEEGSTDFDDYYGNDDDDGDENVLHPLLEDDMERVKNFYGSETISYRLYSAVDSIDVELSFSMGILDREIAIAWKIKPEEPIIVRLHLSMTHYLDGNVPKIEVFQPSQKEKFGIGSQLKKILETFLSEEWKNLSNSLLRCQVKGTAMPSPSSNQLKDDSTLNSDCSQLALGDHCESLKKLTDMGFSKEIAQNALVLSGYETLAAIDLLVTNPDSCTVKPQTAGKQQVQTVTTSGHAGMKSKGRGKLVEPGSTFGHILSKIAKTFEPSMVASVHGDPKRHPGLAEGFLLMIMQYVYQRLPTMNEFCVVCDEPHVFERGGMLKPAVCARELCTFSFLSLGVMSDAADDIATEAEVVNLLIVMANAACQSQKRDVIFEPYPTVVNPLKSKQLALYPEKKDFHKVKTILESFPSITDMLHLREAELKKEMDERDILAYPLLQWIITSNRSHIVKLPAEKQLGFMQTSHQFLLRSSPPAREAIFREAKTKFGSTFAFHGSPLENWHSILRQGLINASGTRYQRHGAAYGKGIYLSPQASVSFGYSGMNQPQVPNLKFYGGNKATRARQGHPRSRHFLKNSNLICIALCEGV